MNRPLPKVHFRKLGKEKAWGLYFPHEQNPLIELDPRMDSKQMLKVLIHEMLHHELPALTEKQVRSISNHIAKVVWGQHFRKLKP